MPYLSELSSEKSDDGVTNDERAGGDHQHLLFFSGVHRVVSGSKEYSTVRRGRKLGHGYSSLCRANGPFRAVC